MSENPRRRGQARNFKTNVPKILDLKSSSEQIFFRKLSLGAAVVFYVSFFRVVDQKHRGEQVSGGGSQIPIPEADASSVGGKFV